MNETFDEKKYIDKSKTGDIVAFEVLVLVNQKKVYNIALRIMENNEDALEVSQEAFIKAFKSISQFKGESSFSTWIYRIVTNICYDEIRKRKTKNVVSIDADLKNDDGEIKREIVDFRPTPDKVLEKKEVRKVICDAISTLPDDQRVAIVLRDVQGFSYEEISDIVKCPEGTIKSRINRARSALREILKKHKELFDFKYVK